MTKSTSKKSTHKIRDQSNKDTVVSIRFTSDDYLLIDKNARESGVTVSEWVRSTATKRQIKNVRKIPEINRRLFLELSASLLEFSNLSKQIKYDDKFENLRNGSVERTLVKIVSQIFEVKRKLI